MVNEICELMALSGMLVAIVSEVQCFLGLILVATDPSHVIRINQDLVYFL
jgi:hypothetical protein